MAITAELNETKALLDAEKVKSAEAAKTIETISAKLAESEKSLTASNALVAEKDATIAKLQTDSATTLAAEKTAHEATKAELATAKATLANPAFAAAAAQGDKKAVKEGGSEAVRVMTFEEAHAEYVKISDPFARAIYRKDHAKELKLEK